MLLRVICAVFCVALASAVECPNSHLVTAGMRQILMKSFSDVEYDCELEARVQKDLEKCAQSSGGSSAEVSSNGDDPRTLMKSMGSYAASMLSSGMTIGCGYDKSKCGKQYTIRCVMERPRKQGRHYPGKNDAFGDDFLQKPVFRPKHKTPPSDEGGDRTPASSGSSSSAAINCPNSEMTPEARKAVLDRHNEYRSMQALGTAVDFIPKVKNMYKMSYSCELEALAQNQVSRCILLHDKSIPGGENLFSGSTSGKLPSVAATALQAADGWWAEIKLLSGMRIGPEELTYSNIDVGHYTAMARHDQMKMGCGYKICGSGRTDFTCRYQYGNMPGATLLQFGEPCKADADCTTFPDSTCIASKGLCSINGEADRVPAKTGSNSRAGSNGGTGSKAADRGNGRPDQDPEKTVNYGEAGSNGEAEPVPAKAGSIGEDGGNGGAGNNGTVEDPSSAAASVIYGTVVLLVTILL